MEFNYKFDDGWYFYEVEFKRVEDALISIFARIYEMDIKKVRELYNQDWLRYDDLKAQYSEELKEFFKSEAYNDYLEVRYA